MTPARLPRSVMVAVATLTAMILATLLPVGPASASHSARSVGANEQITVGASRTPAADASVPASPAQAPDELAANDDPQKIALLLPAVQAAREAPPARVPASPAQAPDELAANDDPQKIALLLPAVQAARDAAPARRRR